VKKRISTMIGAIALAAATAAVAGGAVYGHGDSRAQAVTDADVNATKDASERVPGRSNCSAPVRPQDCKQDGDGSVCVDRVAKHQRSCGGADRSREVESHIQEVCSYREYCLYGHDNYQNDHSLSANKPITKAAAPKEKP
jgi:hypothetical protein